MRMAGRRFVLDAFSAEAELLAVAAQISSDPRRTDDVLVDMSVAASEAIERMRAMVAELQTSLP